MKVKRNARKNMEKLKNEKSKKKKIKKRQK